MATRSLGFRTFVTPQFGVVLFWVMAVPLIVAAVLSIVRGSVWFGIYGFLLVVLIRVVFETMTILFHIHDVLVEIRDKDKVERERAEREAKIARARELASRSKPAGPGESRLEG